MNSVVMGIDPSINSTGICVNKPKKNIYYIIPSKMTKKMTSFKHNRINFFPYQKTDIKNMDYKDKEYAKTINIYNICQNIKTILKKHKPDLVIMEGVSYGSTGSAALVDLSGLQFAIRMLLIDMKVPFIITSPTSVKKFAVANGQAEKDIIIDAWKRLDPEMCDITDIKIDDCADAYFLAHYNFES